MAGEVPARVGSGKMVGALVAGAVATIVVFVLGQFGLTVPPEVHGAIQTVATAALVWLAPSASSNRTDG